MQNKLFKKGLAFGIIIIFIEVCVYSAVAPSINANLNKASAESGWTTLTVKIPKNQL